MLVSFSIPGKIFSISFVSVLVLPIPGNTELLNVSIASEVAFIFSSDVKGVLRGLPLPLFTLGTASSDTSGVLRGLPLPLFTGSTATG